MTDIIPLLSESGKKLFLSLPPSHQKEWLKYINEAKKEETKLKRVLKMQQSLCDTYHLEEDTQAANILGQISVTEQKRDAVSKTFMSSNDKLHCFDKKPYIALLRGVMPTGKNRIPKMAVLQELLSSEFDEVRTYIQSGNIVLLSDKTRDEIALTISRLIKENIGADLATIVVTKEETQEILDKNPFTGEHYLIDRVFFTLTNNVLSAELAEKLLKETFEDEELAIVGNKIYMYLPKDASKTKLNNNYIEKKLKIVATTRNSNTLSKVIVMADEVSC